MAWPRPSSGTRARASGDEIAKSLQGSWRTLQQLVAAEVDADMGKPKAITAAAHKLTRLIDATHTQEQEYTDRGEGLPQGALQPASCATSLRRPKPWACSLSPQTTPLENTMKFNRFLMLVESRCFASNSGPPRRAPRNRAAGPRWVPSCV